MKSSGTSQPEQKSEIARVNRRKYTLCTIDTHFGGIGFYRDGPQWERIFKRCAAQPFKEFSYPSIWAHSRIFVTGRLENQHFRGWGWGFKDEDDKIEKTRSFLFILIQEEKYLFQ